MIGLSFRCSMSMCNNLQILSISDVELPFIYSPTIKERFSAIDLVISCGDLSYYYLEYIISTLDRPLYYVRGNHAQQVEYGSAGTRTAPLGAIDLHRKVFRDPETGLVLAGIEGSHFYNGGPHQYTQLEMWLMVLWMVPSLIWHKIRFGRYLDILVTHAPPWKIHDASDKAHQGIKAFNWLIRVFRPTWHLHGHIHVYHPFLPTETKTGKTRVINTFGYRQLTWVKK